MVIKTEEGEFNAVLQDIQFVTEFIFDDVDFYQLNTDKKKFQ